MLRKEQKRFGGYCRSSRETGILTPVAELAPVFYLGAACPEHPYTTRMRLKKDIRIGDSVYVEKEERLFPKLLGLIWLSVH